MRFGYGLVTCQRFPGDPRSDRQLYEEALVLAERADELGLDSFWVAEHHFWDDAWMSAPLPVLAAMAARTKRIQLATGIMQAPLHHPIHLAEATATVDVLSAGRLLLGLGIGWRDEEYDAFGADPKRPRTRTADTIEVLRRAWGDGLVTDEGLKTISIPAPGLSVEPKPDRPGGPPIWLAGTKEQAARRAAQIADGWFAHGVLPHLLEEQIEWIRDELGDNPKPFEVSACLPLFAWSDGSAWEVARSGLQYYYWKYSDMGPERGRVHTTLGAPPTVNGGGGFNHRGPGAIGTLDPEGVGQFETLGNVHSDEHYSAIVGSPEEVAEGISAYVDVAGDDLHFVAHTYFAGLSLEVQLEAMRVYAEEVIPRVRATHRESQEIGS